MKECVVGTDYPYLGRNTENLCIICTPKGKRTL